MKGKTMKVELTAINRQNKISSKNNKSYVSVGIMTKEHGDKWLNGFGNNGNRNWKKGDAVEITVKQNGEFLNFENADTGKNDDVMNAIRQLYTLIETSSNKILKALGQSTDGDSKLPF
jgi:hypothetical protein